MLDREKFFIEKFNGYNDGYNANPNPNLSPMFNENSRIKSSITHKKIWENLEKTLTKEEFELYKKNYLEQRGRIKGTSP